jgi:ribosomal protein S18 acetylase RimI-like enzyme
MTTDINQSISRPDDIADIARIYRECFPDSIRSLMGQRACVRYFTAVLNDTDADVLIARAGDEIVGFALLLTSAEEPGLRWLIESLPDILHFSFRTFSAILFKSVRKAFKKVIGEAQDIQKSGSTGKAPGEEAMLCLDILGVLKNYRRKGIGRLLVKQCLQVAARDGFDKIELTVKTDNFNAIHLYEGIGFECLIKDDETRYCTLCIRIEPGMVCNGKEKHEKV